MTEEVCEPPARCAAARRAACWKTSIRVEQLREPAPPLGRPVRGGADLWAMARELIPSDEREHFLVFLLDGRHQLKAYAEVSVGSLNSAVVHPREIFRPALLWGAASLLICHNHPSGDPTPSAEDQAITSRIREAGTLLGVPLLDHVVVAADRYFSFLERGALPGA